MSKTSSTNDPVQKRRSELTEVFAAQASDVQKVMELMKNIKAREHKLEKSLMAQLKECDTARARTKSGSEPKKTPKTKTPAKKKEEKKEEKKESESDD